MKNVLGKWMCLALTAGLLAARTFGATIETGAGWTDSTPYTTIEAAFLANDVALNNGKVEWRGSITTAARDALSTPTVGDFVYNTTTAQFEGYNGSAWVSLGTMSGAAIKAAYEAEADTNAFTDAEQAKLAAISGSNTGDEAAASATASGIVELATLAETNAATDATRAVPPSGLATIVSDVAANTAKTSNATHTGHAAGGAALTLQPAAISDQTLVTGASGDHVLVTDASDAGNLKKVDLSDLLAGSGDVTAAANFGTDNRLLRSDGVGKGAQASAITVDDSGNMSGIGDVTASGALNVVGGAIFEGATADAFETTLNAIDPTADNTVNLPNAGGTVALVGVYEEKHAASHTLTFDVSTGEGYGSVHYVTAASTITLDAATDGSSGTIITIGAIAVSVDVNAVDLAYLDGVALDDGDKATNTSTAGDILTWTYYDATGWYFATNGWTDGGP